MTYTAHFDFTAPPFDPDPDPRFIYSHLSYREAFATLQYGIQSRKGFIFISGPSGCGKTTLLRMLTRAFEPTVHTALVLKPPVGFTALLQEILKAFQLPAANDQHAMMSQINQFLIQELRRGRTSCLLFDDAHELSDELLEQIRLLSNLETDKVKLLQIALVSEPELEARLERPGLWQLKQRVVLRHRLQPLGSDEVGAYIASRLKAAGCTRSDIFASDAVEAIAAYSTGIPRLINTICANALALAGGTTRQISLDLVEEVAHHLELRRVPRATNKVQHSAVKVTGEAVEENPEVAGAWEFSGEQFRRREQPSHDRSDGLSGRQKRPGSSWLGVGMLLALMTLVAASLLFYSREIGTSLWRLPARLTSEGVHAASDQSPQRWQAEPALPVSPRPGAHQPKPGPITEKRIEAPRAENNNRESVKAERRVAGNTERRHVRERVFEVVASSFVRDTPRSDADIIATLQPGTRVRLLAQRGQYLEISWLSHTVLRGYVHREDAFFEPVSGPP